MVMEWSPVLGSIQEFTDYALFVVGVLIIYYLIRFLTFGKEEKDKEWAKGGEALRSAIKEKWDASKKARAEREEKEKKEKELAHKKDLVSPIKQNLVDAIESIEELINQIDHKERKKAFKTIKRIEDHLHSAWGNLRLLRRKFEAPEKDQIDKIIVEVESIRKQVLDEVKGKLPTLSASGAWSAPIDHPRNMAVKAKASCGAELNKLKKFHE